MAILRLVFMLCIASCYSPEAPGCVLACTANSDCIGGQACTTDHLCAATGVTTCGAQALTDGGETDIDAGSGETQVDVRISVNGVGKVTTSHGDTCNNIANPVLTCTFKATAGVALTLTATQTSSKPFKDWSGECSDMSNPCTVTPTGSIDIGAKFD